MRRSEPLETGLGRRPLCRCRHPRFHREGSGGILSPPWHTQLRARKLCVQHQKPESQSEGSAGRKRRSWAAGERRPQKCGPTPGPLPGLPLLPQPPSQLASRHNQWGKTVLAKGMVKVISWNGA